MKFKLFFVACYLMLFSCAKQDNRIQVLSGNAQGTTFHITYIDDKRRDFSKEVDSVFKRVNQSLSIYDSTSIISRINNNTYNDTLDQLFSAVFKRANEVSESTNGAFDITIAPLVDAYGFGKLKHLKADSIDHKKLLSLVDFRNVLITNNHLIKKEKHSKLDVNGIAQGYTVDLIADLLKKNSIVNFMVEVGGEVRVSGSKSDGKSWRIGIEKPCENMEGRPLHAIVEMNKFEAMATSGNYRKFYMKDGQKYSHTISPYTGRPVDHNLLSVSVFARDCMTADAYATAFMVLGLERSQEVLIREPQLGAIFIVADKDSYKTVTSDLLLKDMQEVEK